MAAGVCATDAKGAARQETKIAAIASRERFNISQFPLWVKKRPKGHEGLIGYHPRAGLDWKTPTAARVEQAFMPAVAPMKTLASAAEVPGPTFRFAKQFAVTK
jgi:hypothetical protein